MTATEAALKLADYKIEVERRLSRMETSIIDLRSLVEQNAKDTKSLIKTVARLSVITPLLGGLLFLLGYLIR